MTTDVTIENGFAVVPGGDWLVPHHQPVAYSGTCSMRLLKGWFCPDRMRVLVVRLSGTSRYSCADRPFLTHIPVAAPLTILSEKLLIAPAEARSGAKLIRVIPLSFRSALVTTSFETGWAVMATKSRTARVSLAEEEVLTVQANAAVAWTTKPPTGFCPKIRLRDVFIPKPRPGSLMLNFYGPGIVWLEGA